MRKQNLTRRDILKSGCALTAGLAAPYVIPADALGNDEKPAPSERVTVAHIGVGGRGRVEMREFMKVPNAQNVAAVDAYKSRRDAAATLMKAKPYADFREVLGRDDIDAVVITTPDHWHVPIAIAAAKAGKAAFVAKPLGLTIEQNIACRKAFEKSGSVFQYGTQQRSLGHCYLGCELARGGKLGKVHTIEVIAPNGGSGGSTEPAPVPEDLDYDMWIGPAPMVPYTVNRCKPKGTYWIYDYSIGYLAGWGAHPLDIMIWGSDADQSGLVTVDGTGKIPSEGLYDCVIDWDMRIQLGDVKMTFKPGGNDTKFIGTEGWVAISRGRIDAEPKSLLDELIAPEDATLVKSDHHAGNFVDAILGKIAPVAPVDEAVRSDVLSHLCDIAVRTGRKITWDPKTETILDDPDAAKLTSRPMRAPWTL